MPAARNTTAPPTRTFQQARLPSLLRSIFPGVYSSLRSSGVCLMLGVSATQAATVQVLTDPAGLAKWSINGTQATSTSTVNTTDTMAAELTIDDTDSSGNYWLFYTNSENTQGNITFRAIIDALAPVNDNRGLILFQGVGNVFANSASNGPIINATVLPGTAEGGFNFGTGQFTTAQDGPTSGIQIRSVGEDPGYTGGAVNVELASDIRMLGAPQNVNGGTLPWRPALAGITARSLGADGFFERNCNAGTSYCQDTILPGYNAGTVTLSTLSGLPVHIQIGSEANNLTLAQGSAAVGLLAVSQGGMGATQGFSGTAGSNGYGSDATIRLGPDQITSTTSSVIGVVAASVGGASVVPAGAKVNVVPSGASGRATVELNGTRITLSENNAIGVAATSTGDVIVPGNSSLSGSGANTMGPASVELGSNTIISVGNPNGARHAPTDTNIGVLALSAPGWATAPFTGAQVSPMHSPGAAGSATITLDPGAAVSVYGDGAIGLLAQSLAGNGASASGGTQAFVGDQGGPGGTAESVTVINSGGRISTQGDGAIGALLQSIAGGGGNGGNATGLFVAVGGNGGNGGQGGDVSFSQSVQGSITTRGDYAQGLVLQSVGGGGGNGGFAKAYSLIVPAATGIGGQGGIAGNGGAIQLAGDTDTSSDNTGSINTQGQHAHGIVAHSIGGGGGTGGAATSVDASLFTLDIAVGGNGAGAGNGGQITGNNNGPASSAGTVTTRGHDAHGVVLQSIGGGGGVAGGSTAASLSAFVPPDVPTLNIDAAIGGNGGNGGDGGLISFLARSAISTRGTAAHGVTLQSIGGGGGLGGDATAGAGSFLQAASLTFNGSVGIGGSGSQGGSGGPVSLTTLAPITTQGHHAVGLTAQSIGGGGGIGGIGNAAAIVGTSLEEASAQIEIGVGGSGGTGGAGGTVSIDASASGTISTQGSGAAGILAQSIGGGGGIAGNAGAQAIGGKFSQGVTVGGTGGSGNTAGTVGLNFAGRISTGANYQIRYTNASGQTQLTTPVAVGGGAHALVAQSIGGGGGIGGNADPAAAIVPDLAGSIIDDANKLLDVKGSLLWWAKKVVDYDTEEYEFPKAFKSKVAVGGSGGSGGDGSTVNVALGSNTRIATTGHRTYALLAQSIGGGGGLAGSASGDSLLDTDIGLSPLTGFDFDVGLNVGGTNGAAGNGDDVNVTISNPYISGQDNRLISSGHGSHLMLLQSIGGGGGVAHEGSIFGVSGKLAGLPVPSVTLGSSSGRGNGLGNAGGVTLGSRSTPVTGLFETAGDDASVAVLQSIGGGGGLASVGCTNSGRPQSAVVASSCFTNTGSLGSTPVTKYIPDPFVNKAQAFNLNIQGNSDGSGDDIEVTLQSANMHTTGDRATVLVAQSISGGGGYATADSRNIAATSIQAGQNPAGTRSGRIDMVLSNAELTTAGHGSWGILAQSILGGGGLLGDTSADLLAIPQAGPGSQGPLIYDIIAGNINIQLTDRTLIQTGDSSSGVFPVNTHGIVAQSLGSGGGIQSGYNQARAGMQPSLSLTALNSLYGAGGSITIGVDPGSTINAQGIGAIGILAQTGGQQNAGNAIDITINGTVNGGRSGVNPFTGNTLSGTGVMLSGGSNTTANTVTVGSGGLLTTYGGTTSGYALSADYGVTHLVNQGTVTGNVYLGSQGSTFVNQGLFQPGSTVNIQGNRLENSGTVQVGDENMIVNTVLTGDYLQTGEGRLVFGSTVTAGEMTHSRLQVQGAANVAGTIEVASEALLPGTLPVLQADQLTVTAAVAQPMLYRWDAAVSGTTLGLTPTANFQPAGLSLDATGSSLAGYLERAWQQADVSKARLFGYLSTVRLPGAYQDALRQIGGQSLLAQPQQLINASYDMFNDGLMCPNDAISGVRRQGNNCTWARISGNRSDQSGTHSTLGYRSEGSGLRIGIQHTLNAQWRLGASAGASQNRLTANGFSSRGKTYDASVSVTHQRGPLEITGALAVARGNYRNERTPQLGVAGRILNLEQTYNSASDTTLLGARLRTAYTVQRDGYFVKPYLDLDLIHTRSPGFTESGRGPLALEVGGVNKTQVVISPMVQVGTQRELDSGAVVRGYVSAGASILPNNQRTSQNRLAGSNARIGSFNLTSEGPKAVGRLNLGLEVKAPKQQNVTFRAEYSAQAGGNYRSQNISAQLNIRF